LPAAIFAAFACLRYNEDQCGRVPWTGRNKTVHIYTGHPPTDTK
jgi:hypothetical protein